MGTSTITPQFVTVAEAATWLSISEKQVRRKVADGSLKAYKVGGQALRIRLSDLESLVRPVR